MKISIPSSREEARALRAPVYYGPRCEIDGNVYRNTETGKCSECERYSKAVSSGRINGFDGRIKGRDLKPVKVEMCAEERQERSRVIKVGIKRAKVEKKRKVVKVTCAACEGRGLTGRIGTNDLRACKTCKGNCWTTKVKDEADNRV